MCVGIEQKVEAFGNIPILGSAWLTGPAATSPAGSWLISDVISSFFQLTTVKTDSSPALLFECEFSLPLYCKKRKEKKKKRTSSRRGLYCSFQPWLAVGGSDANRITSLSENSLPVCPSGGEAIKQEA